MPDGGLYLNPDRSLARLPEWDPIKAHDDMVKRMREAGPIPFADTLRHQGLSEEGRDMVEGLRRKLDREILPETEIERDCSLVIEFSTYGTAEQAQKTAEVMVRTLEVKGHTLRRAVLDGKDLIR